MKNLFRRPNISHPPSHVKPFADADGIVFYSGFFFFFFLLGNLFNFKRQRHTKEMDGNKLLENFRGCFHVGINRVKKW